MKNNIIILSTIIILILSAFILIGRNSYGGKSTTVPSNTHTSWMQYENKTPDFSFLYPESVYLYKNDGTAFVSLSALGPDDSRRASDIGLLSTLVVRSFEEDNIKTYIQTVEQDQFTEHFTSSEVTLDNGVTIPTIAYNNAFGVRTQESFIDIGGGNVLFISFAKDTMYSDMFFEILQSFEWRRL